MYLIYIFAYILGGHGRTGTIVSIMLHIMYGFSSDEAMNYCQHTHDLRKINVNVKSPQTNDQRQQVARIIKYYRINILPQMMKSVCESNTNELKEKSNEKNKEISDNKVEDMITLAVDSAITHISIDIVEPKNIENNQKNNEDNKIIDENMKKINEYNNKNNENNNIIIMEIELNEDDTSSDVKNHSRTESENIHELDIHMDISPEKLIVNNNNIKDNSNNIKDNNTIKTNDNMKDNINMKDDNDIRIASPVNNQSVDITNTTKKITNESFKTPMRENVIEKIHLPVVNSPKSSHIKSFTSIMNNEHSKSNKDTNKMKEETYNNTKELKSNSFELSKITNEIISNPSTTSTSNSTVTTPQSMAITTLQPIIDSNDMIEHTAMKRAHPPDNGQPSNIKNDLGGRNFRAQRKLNHEI